MIPSQPKSAGEALDLIIHYSQVNEQEQDRMQDRFDEAVAKLRKALTAQAGEVVESPQIGDIILFKAVAGHTVYGKEQEFIGRIESDAKGLHAANYYQFAWKNMRIIERSAKSGV